MSNFYIWNPFNDSDKPNTVSLVLTNGDITNGIFQDNEFASHLLQDIGISTPVINWTATPYRSLYFSEYLDEEDWRDNWPIVWRIYIETEPQPYINFSNKHVPWIPTNATGENWEKVTKGSFINSLVVSDFKKHSSVQQVMNMLSSDSKVVRYQEAYGVKAPKYEQIKTIFKHNQLQIDLGEFSESFFQNGADYAHYVMGLCRQQGGSVHHETAPS